MTPPATFRPAKKLIEVALPLIDINAASAHEKKVKVGKPTSVHHWFAPRTLSVARAMLFAQMVNDPGGHRGYLKGKTKKQADEERESLFSIIRELVDWNNYNNTSLLRRAADIIKQHWDADCQRLGVKEPLPAFLDPFCGRGVLPLEAQNLGFDVFAFDLNPIPVLINQAILYYPKRFRETPPACPEISKGRLLRSGKEPTTDDLINDIQAYGKQLLDRTRKALVDMYPAAKHEGRALPVVAWIWARTVRTPDPALGGVHVPLISSFTLASKGKKRARLRPIVEGSEWRFEIDEGESSDKKQGTVGRTGATCLVSGRPIALDYIREEARAGRLGTRLIAIVADSGRGRVYLPAHQEHEARASDVRCDDSIRDIRIDHWPGCTNCVVYGYETFLSLFSSRQRKCLTTFIHELAHVRACIVHDALASGRDDGAEYADAIVTYLSLALSRTADWNNTFSRWEPKAQVPQQLFGRHSISMCWDFAEANPLYEATGSFWASIQNICKSLARNNVSPHIPIARVQQHDANDSFPVAGRKCVVSTDPPYFDNIPYSNLADFFYLWLREALREVHPSLFATTSTPKAGELVANRFRHGGPQEARRFFMNGMAAAIANLKAIASPLVPITIYYAFKQKEEDEAGDEHSAGWATFLQALVDSGFQITGTWPVRSESTVGLKENWNALASSIVLVCRPRTNDAQQISRRQFVRELNETLPDSLEQMTRNGSEVVVAPVDLSQAIIGPGMAVFSKYAAVLEADGSPMTVRTALQLINRFLAEDDFDADTQFCLHWFEQHGWESGKFGEADTLARAKGTSVDGVKHSGVLQSAGGNVRLLKWADYKPDWDPSADDRLPVWEGLHQLVRVFKTDGESAAGKVLAAVAAKAEPIRQLAYRLYTLCERAGRAEDARAYNELITSWSPIESAAAATPSTAPAQKTLFE
jgi:putative DNA methylase